jgi:non-ribosomal peptide synthetase component F
VGVLAAVDVADRRAGPGWYCCAGSGVDQAVVNRASRGHRRTPVSIPVLFAAQVARALEAVALSCGGQSLTYREVEEAANPLAHLLAAQGVCPGECVGLLFSC